MAVLSRVADDRLTAERLDVEIGRPVRRNSNIFKNLEDNGYHRAHKLLLPERRLAVGTVSRLVLFW
jgi:hypothetical protein